MNKKKIIALLLVAIIGSIIFWKRDYLKEKLGLSKNNSETEPESTKPTTPAQPKIVYREATDFPFKLGDKGDKVKAIQISLNKYWGANLQLDGMFGYKTEAAMVKAGFGKTLEYTEVAALVKKYNK